MPLRVIQHYSDNIIRSQTETVFLMTAQIMCCTIESNEKRIEPFSKDIMVCGACCGDAVVFFVR